MYLLRINMTDRTYKLEDVPDKYKNLGGRGLTSNIVADEVPPLCHPLGPNNKVVFASGILTGTPANTSARVSVGGKSPLTGGIKEANAGSSWARDLQSMQIKALIVEGQAPEKGKYWGMMISWDAAASKPKVEFFDATGERRLAAYRNTRRGIGWCTGENAAGKNDLVVWSERMAERGNFIGNDVGRQTTSTQVLVLVRNVFELVRPVRHVDPQNVHTFPSLK